MPALVFVALMLTATSFAELGAVNVKFDGSTGRDRLGAPSKTMTVGEVYPFSVRLYDENEQEVSWRDGSSARCIVGGGIGEANATINTCFFYAKKKIHLIGNIP